MRKNIFLKSMLRQPLRTGLLILLIAVGAFAFYLRTVEYIVVQNQVTELSRLYRSIGTIQRTNYWDDISEAADVIARSPFVETIDQRVTLEGVIEELYSESRWVWVWESNRWNRVRQLDTWHNIRGADIHGAFPGTPRNNRLRVMEAIIEGLVLDIQIPSGVNSPAHITIEVSELYAGMHEIATPTQHITVLYRAPIIGGQRDFSNIEGLEVGDSYLLRVEYPLTFQPVTGAMMTPRTWANDMLNLIPLDDGLWFAPADIDLTSPDFSHIQDDIAFLRHNARGVLLIPTRDMNAMPLMQPWAATRLGYLNAIASRVMRLQRGRLIDAEDDEAGNHVVVISMSLAWGQNIDVGDILRISIPQEQQVVGLARGYGEVVVRGTPEEEPLHVLDLEVVGIFQDFARGNAPGAPLLYIPASIVPAGITMLPPPPGAIPGWDSPDHIPSIWHSFTLSDTRTDQEFFVRYSEILADLGFHLTLFESDSAEFWATIDPMLLIITFNAVVFWAVLVLVMALVVFLFIQGRRKEMAIQRGLGFSAGRVVWRMVGAMTVFAIPAIVIGGVAGWHHALGTAEHALTPLVEVVSDVVTPGGETVLPVVDISFTWFIVMGAGIFAALLAFTLGGLIHAIHLPILEQLQGVKAKKVKKAKKLAHGTAAPPLPMPTNLTLSKFEPVFTSSERQKSSMRWVLRHMLRSPIKTTLGVLVALFFILVLGWLQESMLRTEESIYHLYETTEVSGAIMRDPFHTWDNRELGDVILRDTVTNILNSGVVANAYIESGHSRAFVIAPGSDGNFPDNWSDHIGFDKSVTLWRNFHTLNFIYAVNDFDRFAYLNSFDEDNSLTVEFAAGFDISHFYQSTFDGDTERIPIIVSQHVLDQRGVGLGDEVFIGYTLLSPTLWDSVPAVIIGVHNGHVETEAAREAIFMYIPNLEGMMRGLMMYSAFNFTIDPAYNRIIEEVREFLTQSVQRGAMLDIWIFMTDQMLHNMISIATQTLVLLGLVYPVAVGAAVFIASGLALLLMLQNAKKAATMHVLGMSKLQTMGVLLSEQIYVTLAGMVPAVIVLAILGVTLSTPLLISFGLYFAGVFICAFVGAVLIVRREPLELLQVKE